MANVKRKCLAVCLVLLSTTVLGSPVHPRLTDADLLDGHQIINIVNDVSEFWKKANGLSLRRARRLWIETVEKKHADYFERAVYGDAEPAERRAMLDEFLLQLPRQIEAMRRFNERVEDRVLDGVVAFKWRFPEYRQSEDIYIGVSFFRFDGSVRPVHNQTRIPDTLCLGAEVLASYRRDQIEIAIAHELFHLYHFGYLLRENHPFTFATPHMPLMIEGMAVAATEAIYPNRPAELYLHFSPEELSRQRELLEWSSRQFLGLMYDGAGPDEYRGWFTFVPGEPAPARGGYLLGYEVSKRLLRSFSFEEISRMSVEQLREHAEEELAGIAFDRVLLESQ